MCFFNKQESSGLYDIEENGLIVHLRLTVAMVLVLRYYVGNDIKDVVGCNIR